MKSYRRSHLADRTLTQSLATSTAKSREATADQLADLGEFDARRLYLPAGYPSMFQYCLQELHLCEQAAFKRIRAARAARRFPIVFHAVADGRLHLSAVVLLRPHLTQDNVDDLLAAATHKSKSEIQRLLADRFPSPDLPTVLEALSPPAAPVPASFPSPALVATAIPGTGQLSPGTVQVETPALTIPPRIEPARVTPIFPGHSRLHVTIDQETEDQLRYAQALLGRAVPIADLTAVLKRLVQEGIGNLEKRKLGAGDPARAGPPRSESEGRYVPTEVRRAVWKRDGGRCTFTSPDGSRCPECLGLEFDHIEPYAQGGAATVANLRLLCRAHNQYLAEQTYGAEFMRLKRQGAAEAREVDRQAARAR